MGKVLKPLAIIAAIAVNVIPGAGQAISAGIFGAIGTGTFAALGLASTLGSIATAAITTGGLAAASGGGRRGGAGGAATLTAFDPQVLNPDTATPRKLVFGRTLFPVDLRYTEPSGTNQEYIDYIFALAAHKADAITDIYIEDDLAWTVGGGVQGKYVGYLGVEIILEAGSGAYHTVNGGSIWGASQRLTGCTTMKVRVKRSDNSTSSQSPFASGIGGRWAVIGRGMPVYDPARDSTVAGGSGSQRANDHTTWAYTASSVARGNNPALQLLSFLLGWKIGGVVSVGCGLPADVIDLPSFAVAAALCDESVALAAGGSQRRFEAGRAFTDADDPAGVIKVLLDAMNGELVDDGGRLALRIAVNDLTPAVTLTDDDFVSGYRWQPQPSIDRQFTVVRGRYSQPDAPTLFNLVDFPEVAIPRTSLAPRVLPLELSAVQEARRAERIAKQAAQRSLYQGQFSVTIGIRGWLLKRNMVVAITSSVRGWSGKIFRVRSLSFTPDGQVEATFRAEDASVYAWDADESAAVTPVAPVVFDSRRAASYLMAGIAPGANLTAPANANLVPFSKFERTDPWVVRDNSGAVDIVGLTPATVTQRRQLVGTVDFTAAGQLVSLGHEPRFPVTPLQWLDVSGRVEAVGTAEGSWSLVLFLWDSPSTGSAFVVATGTGGVTIAGGIVGGLVQVPAGYREGEWRVYALSGSAGALSFGLCEPMAATAVAGQTLRPPFTPGPNSVNGADVTAANTALNTSNVGGVSAAIVEGRGQLMDAGTGRAVTRRMLPQIINSGVIQVVGNAILTSATDGFGVATITIAEHPVLDETGTLIFTASSIGGLAASTEYYVYEINPNYVAGARTYSATTDRNLLATAGARFVGFIITGAAGGSSAGTGAGAGFQTPGNPEWEP